VIVAQRQIQIRKVFEFAAELVDVDEVFGGLVRPSHFPFRGFTWAARRLATTTKIVDCDMNPGSEILSRTTHKAHGRASSSKRWIGDSSRASSARSSTAASAISQPQANGRSVVVVIDQRLGILQDKRPIFFRGM
jgi:hypothetical protein